jgi:hypothetical protein
MKNQKTKYPLRKVIGIESVQISDGKYDGIKVFVNREKLECGHTIPIPSDIYGETNAYFRRCKQCGKREV